MASETFNIVAALSWCEYVVVVGLVTGDAMFPFRVSDIPITYGYCGKPCPRFARWMKAIPPRPVSLPTLPLA